MINITVIGSCFTTESQIKKLWLAGFCVNRLENNLSNSVLIQELNTTNSLILIIGGSSYITNDLIKQTNIKYIFFAGTNYKTSIDCELSCNKSVVISNAPHLNCNSVAELTIALILNSYMNIYNHFHSTSSFVANRKELRHDILSLNIGIIGLGHIGYRVAEILKKGFNVEHLNYYSRNRKYQAEKLLCIKYSEFDILIKNLDVIIITYSENSSTKNMIYISRKIAQERLNKTSDFFFKLKKEIGLE